MSDSQVPKHYQVWCEPNERFFERTYAAGGWPEGLPYATFFHSGVGGQRPVKFTSLYRRDGWHTTFTDRAAYDTWLYKHEALGFIRSES